MTLKEAKNILKKEGFHLVLVSKVINQTGAIREFEKPEVCEAIKVANANKWTVGLSPIEWDEREALLKEEYEKNHIKCGEPIPGTPLGAVEGKRLRWKDNNNTDKRPKEGNPALAEAATQFNDALLDEQAKKIARLKKIIHKKNLKIEELKKERSEHLAGEVKFFGETVDLSQELCDKNEELRLTKIREKNLTEVCQKYMKEIEELRKELADKVVDKIDAQALKSAESALAYKESYIEKLKKEIAERTYYIKEKYEEIDKLTKENNDYKKVVEEFRNKIADMTIGKIDIQNIHLKEKNKEIKELNDKLKSINMNRHNERVYKKQLSEKDEVIDDLDKELEATKNELEEKNYLIDMLRCGSREYCEYGIAAEKMIQKMAKVIVKEGAVSSEDFKEYRRLANGYRFNPQLPEFSVEEEKKLTAKTLDFNAKCMKAARESINDVFESYAAKYAKCSLDDLKEKAYESFNAKAHNLGLVGSKDGNGLLNQMAGADVAEEGGDQSATIVQCGNGITLSKEEAEIVERCTKNGTELHYSEKDGLTYTNVFGEEMPIRCLRGMFHVFTDEEIENLKK